jgi:hypothetical protein
VFENISSFKNLGASLGRAPRFFVEHHFLGYLSGNCFSTTRVDLLVASSMHIGR